MKDLNFGVIGTNFISDWFCDTAESVHGVKVLGVYSRNRATGDAFAKKHAVERVYTSLDEMLADKDIDAVYVASPTFMHKEHSVRAMKAGKHVLCEKMIAVTEGEFLEMRDVSERMGVTLLEAMRPDFDGAHELIKANLPRLGRIRRAEFNYCQYSSRYDKFKAGEVLNAFDPGMKNSSLADIGVYALHTCISYFGRPISLSSASVFLENGFEGAGTVLLKYDGMNAVVSYSKIADNMTPSVIEGEYGSITFDRMNAPERITLRMRGKEPEALPFEPSRNNMIYEIEAFRDMVRGERSAKEYLDITAETMSAVEKIYKCSGIGYVEL